MSSQDENVRPGCPQCDGDAPSTPYWDTPRFHRCTQCGLIFRSPFPDEATLCELYNNSWASPDVNRTETGMTELRLAETYSKSLLRTIEAHDLSGKRVLDFGAGRGGMALALRNCGAEVTAVDPFGRDYLQSMGLAAYSDLDELPADLRFDGIVSLEVLEHLPAPGQTLAKVCRRLKPGAWVFVTTPNPEGLPATLFGDRWREAAKPGHIVFFTSESLRALLEESGFSRVRRLRWLLRYPSASFSRAVVHYAMQAALLDGSLRFLAFKD